MQRRLVVYLLGCLLAAGPAAGLSIIDLDPTPPPPGATPLPAAWDPREHVEAVPIRWTPHTAIWRSVPPEEARRIGQEPRRSAPLEDLAREAALRAVEETGGGMVVANDIWVTVIDARDSHDPRVGSYQGDRPVYPASVIKMCYMAAAYRQAQLGLIEMNAEVRKTIHDMMHVSSNEATADMVDLLTNTRSGPELEGEARLSFEHKRQAVHRYMEELGLPGLWAVQKTYGGQVVVTPGDFQWLGNRKWDNYERSNMMTTDDTARLLYMLWRRALVDRMASEEMLKPMYRGERDDSGFGFNSITPDGWELYSKGGSTGLDLHDAGIFVSPGGGEAIIVVAFSKTRNVEGDRPRTIHRAAELVLEELLQQPAILDWPEEGWDVMEDVEDEE